jgi:hypothetical protein
MSIPSCIRPQRQPNPLVTGPETGQTKPAAEGPEELEAGVAEPPLDGLGCEAALCAAWILLLAREQPVALGAALLRPDLDHRGRLPNVQARALGLRARRLHLALRGADLARDHPILRSERAEVVELVEDRGEARGGEHDLERRRVARLVDRDEPLVQALLGGPVLSG